MLKVVIKLFIIFLIIFKIKNFYFKNKIIKKEIKNINLLQYDKCYNLLCDNKLDGCIYCIHDNYFCSIYCRYEFVKSFNLDNNN
jgi:hypothetical protein